MSDPICPTCHKRHPDLSRGPDDDPGCDWDTFPGFGWVDENYGNKVREDGVDRCYCGCKYWENDRCIDCGGSEVAA